MSNVKSIRPRIKAEGLPTRKVLESRLRNVQETLFDTRAVLDAIIATVVHETPIDEPTLRRTLQVARRMVVASSDALNSDEMLVKQTESEWADEMHETLVEVIGSPSSNAAAEEQA